MSTEQLIKLLLTSTYETLYMTLMALFFASLIGVPVGILLYGTRPNRFLENKKIYYPLGFIVNIVRSIPYIILAISIIPVTRFIAGTSIGNTAAIVPLTIASAPFIARMIEGVLNEVDVGLIEAAQAMGASKKQIIFKILLPESISGIINALTITLIALIGYSAIAGSLGAGGLGKTAYNYGHLRYKTEIILYTVCIIVLIVQIIQFVGDFLAKKFNHRK